MKKQAGRISAVKKRPSGAEHRRRRSGGENVLWHRVTANFDDAVKVFAANPEIASPITRLVFFKHLTQRQGMAARLYGEIMEKWRRFYVDEKGTLRSANLEPSTVYRTEDELERRFWDGSLEEYYAAADGAKRDYTKMSRIMDAFRDPITGRNQAKNVLDDLCLSDIEPPAAWRDNLALVLNAIAEAFDVNDKRKGKR